MEGKKHLYFALGQLAYAVAKADGKIPKREKKKLYKIVTEELSKLDDENGDYSDMIFHILEKEKREFETTYNWAIQSMKLDSHYFSDKMKTQFVNIIRKVAKAFPSDSIKGHEIINRFNKDMTAIKPK